MVRRLLRAVAGAAISDWRPHPPRYAIAGTFCIALVLLGIDGAALFRPAPFPSDRHANMSLALALSERYCGRHGVLNSQHIIGDVLVQNTSLLSRDFGALMQWQAGSVQQYCAGLDYPFLNNENSLLLVMRAGLFLQPSPTPARVGQFLTAVRLVLVLAFAYVLLRAGCGWLLAALSVLAIGRVMVLMQTFEYSMYDFFVPLIVGMTAFYTIAFSWLKSRPIGWHCAFFVVAGFLTSFCANMRSSHLPLYTGMFLAAVAATVKGRSWPAARASAAAVSFTAGYVLFGAVLIAPLRPAETPSEANYTHHVIAHPLVLGLAVPESSLSRREGIYWDDADGLQLARRMVPDAVYLGQGYEEGLLLYYLKLWLQYPSEMRQIYLAKLSIAGTGMFGAGHWEARSVIARAVIPRLRSGFRLLALYLGALIAAAVWFWRREASGALLCLLLSIAAVAMFIESAVIMPWFYLQYHGYLLVYTGMLAAFTIEAIATQMVGAGRRLRS